jgi:HIV Tat-specific factor 1
VEASIATGRERFKKTRETKHSWEDDDDEEENKRLDGFGAWLEQGEGDEDR